MAVVIPEGYCEAAAQPVIAITGPTATGKTHLAVQLAREFNGEILSVDSRQVYKGLDLGTGKDLSEYSEGGPAVPCHLLDIADPAERYDLYRYLDEARAALAAVRKRGHLPVLCGGTPLYLQALLLGYGMFGGAPNQDLRAELEPRPLEELVAILKAEATPELLARTDLTQSRRVIRAIEMARAPDEGPPPPPLSKVLLLAPLYTRAEVRDRIEKRLDARLEIGLLDEVRNLHEKQHLPWEQLEWLGLEYRFCGRYLSGKLGYTEMRQQLLDHIRQFAKRQDIWFRKIEREGRVIHWIPEGNLDAARSLVKDFLQRHV